MTDNITPKIDFQRPAEMGQHHEELLLKIAYRIPFRHDNPLTCRELAGWGLVEIDGPLENWNVTATPLGQQYAAHRAVEQVSERAILSVVPDSDYVGLWSIAQGAEKYTHQFYHYTRNVGLLEDRVIPNPDKPGHQKMVAGLSEIGKRVTAQIPEYLVSLMSEETIKSLVEAKRTNGQHKSKRFREWGITDESGTLTNFGHAVAATAEIVQAGFTLADVTPAPDHVTPADNMVGESAAIDFTDPLATMDAEALRQLVRAERAEKEELRLELSKAHRQIEEGFEVDNTLRKRATDAEASAAEANRQKFKAQQLMVYMLEHIMDIEESRDTYRTLSDSFKREKEQATADAQKWQREHAKVVAAHNEANELLESFTTQHPDGHVVLEGATAQHLDRFTGEGRNILHISFNRDGDMHLVVGPKPKSAPVQPERSTARTESPTQPRRPVPPPVQQPPAPRPSVPAMPTASAAPITPTAIIPVAPTTNPQRVPTFMEIVEARANGQIDAAQFTRFANALAGYNASKKA